MDDAALKDIARLNAESIENRRRIERMEDNDKRHEESIRQLYAHQEGTKAYVTQILGKLEQMETKLFTLVTNLSKDNKAERRGWQDLIKYVIGATIGALIIYMFTQEGVTP